MDTKYINIQIILALTDKKTCPLIALIQLYTLDLQLTDALLFLFLSGAFFTLT